MNPTNVSNPHQRQVRSVKVSTSYVERNLRNKPDYRGSALRKESNVDIDHAQSFRQVRIFLLSISSWYVSPDSVRKRPCKTSGRYTSQQTGQPGGLKLAIRSYTGTNHGQLRVVAKPVNIGVDGMLGQESTGGVVHRRTASDGKSILLGRKKCTPRCFLPLLICVVELFWFRVWTLGFKVFF